MPREGSNPMFGRELQKAIGMVLIAGTVALIASQARCEEAPRPRKPSVCLNWEIGQAGSHKVAVCLDNAERPVLFRRFAEVKVDGQAYLLGWR